jgi:hypothetical protein
VGIEYGDAYAVMLGSGDGYAMYGYAIGGSDTVIGSNAEAYWDGDAYAVNVLTGDAYILAEYSAGGNDHLVGGNAYGDGYGGQAGALNMMSGDALDAYGAIKVGNDELTGGTGMNDGYALNIMYGDVGSSLFGDNAEALGAAVGDMLGAFTADVSIEVSDPYAATTYGNDKLYGGAEQALNYMVGDTEELYGGDVGGNDLLVAGDWDTENYLVGDALYMEEGATGGNDRLVSGHSDDMMVGDAENNYGVGGKDVFVFAMDNGNDVILDFEVGKDKLSLMVFGKARYAFHVLSQDGRMEDTESGVLLHLDLEDPTSEYNTVLLVGVSAEELTMNSFM